MAKSDPTLLIPSNNSTGEQWKQFYISLDATFPKQQANEIFLAFWNNRGNKSSVTTDLLTFMKSKGVVIDAPLKARAGEMVGNIKDSVSDLFKFSFGSSILVTGIALILAIKLINNFIKDPNKYAGVAKTIATKGRA
jgi:hypothetical protein